MDLPTSIGIKRYLATTMGTVLLFLQNVPYIGPIVSFLFLANGTLGVVGLAHGAMASTLGINIPSTFGAALAALYAIASHIPAAAPYLPIIQLLLATVGGAAISKGLPDEDKIIDDAIATKEGDKSS